MQIKQFITIITSSSSSGSSSNRSSMSSSNRSSRSRSSTSRCRGCSRSGNGGGSGSGSGSSNGTGTGTGSCSGGSMELDPVVQLIKDRHFWGKYCRWYITFCILLTLPFSRLVLRLNFNFSLLNCLFPWSN